MNKWHTEEEKLKELLRTWGEIHECRRRFVEIPMETSRVVENWRK
ncbi:hypothetical protein [Candidatus Alkanophaga liquidiphilum]